MIIYIIIFLILVFFVMNIIDFDEIKKKKYSKSKPKSYIESCWEEIEKPKR